MVFDIKKKLFATTDPFVVLHPTGGNPFVVQPTAEGMFVANEHGELIAQVIFDKGSATVAVAEDDDALTVFADGKITTAKDRVKYLVYGNPGTYTYDIFAGKKLAAKVAPKFFDKHLFSINHTEGNLLKLVLIVLALEKMYFAG